MNQSERRDVDVGDPSELTAAIVETVAAQLGGDPTDLPALHDAVDPEAAAAVLDTAADASVTFEYANTRVVVHASGVVSVTDA